MKSGIYKIQSKCKPDRIYIGSAINIEGRKRAHFSRLKHGYHHSIKLQRHYDKYGYEDLEFSIITICKKDELIKLEQVHLDEINPYFNICKIAGSTLGRKHTEEHKEKLRAIFANKEYTQEDRLKFSSFLGKNHSEETKKKISDGNKGKIVSKESKEKMRKSHLGNQNRLGAILTEETKNKISESNKGKIAWNKGKTLSEETKKKIKESWIKRKAKINIDNLKIVH